MPPKDSRRYIPSEKQVTRFYTAEEVNAGKQPEPWTILDFDNARINAIPTKVLEYGFLTGLYLSHNHLRVIPAGIGRLRGLQLLDVSSNHIRVVPPEIGLLLSLKELNLSNNEIDNLPLAFGKLFCLQVLCLQGNPLNDGVLYLLRDGVTPLLEHLVDQLPPEEPPARSWIVSPDFPPEIPPTQLFTLVDYNVLCDRYTSKQIYGWCPLWALQWEHRRERILNEIIKQLPDIITLQEVETSEFYAYFLPNLHARGYDGLFRPKSRARTMSEQDRAGVDGCAIFFNDSKFVLREDHLLEFASLATMRSAGAPNMLNRVMPKDNIALVAVLSHRATSAPLVVVNTHFTWDPQFQDVKLIQAMLMMSELRSFLETSQLSVSVPTLICGDLNSLPDSGVVEFLASSKISQSHSDFGPHDYGKYFTPANTRHPLRLKSAYGSELQFTNYTEAFRGVIDYIWHTAPSLLLHSVLAPVAPGSLTYVGCPNAAFASDHIMLAAKFAFRP